MSFAISGTNYGIATQEEGYACGLLNSYTTSTNNDKKLLSLQYIQSNSKNVNGPSYWKYYSDMFIPTKTTTHQDLFTFGPLKDIYGSNNLEITIEATTNITSSDLIQIGVIAYNPSKNVATIIYGLSGYDLNAILTNISNTLSNSFTQRCDENNNISKMLHYEDTVIGLYIEGGVYREIEFTFGYLQKDRLVTGKSFQSYNITRPWHWRISEDYFWGDVSANTITAQYRYSNTTNVPNSMTVKEFLSRGSAYFGGSISDGKTVSVNLPVNRFYILGRTGSLASLPTYDKLTFWCGSTKSNSEWYGYYAQRNSAGELLSDWKNKVTLASTGTSIIHGNDSQDAPFYSWNFLQTINNAYGVNILVI